MMLITQVFVRSRPDRLLARRAQLPIHGGLFAEEANLLHSYGTVDACAFEHDDGLGVDVSIDHRGALEFEAFVRDDGSVDETAQHDFPGMDIAFDGAVAAKHQLPRAQHGTLDAAVDFQGAVRFEVSRNAHAGG